MCDLWLQVACRPIRCSAALKICHRGFLSQVTCRPLCVTYVREWVKSGVQGVMSLWYVRRCVFGFELEVIVLQ